jgi:hypothetical protein
MMRIKTGFKQRLKHDGNVIDVIRECNQVSSEDQKHDENGIRFQAEAKARQEWKQVSSGG